MLQRAVIMAAASCLLVVPTATAEPADTLERVAERNFWDWLIAPNAEEIAVVLTQANQHYTDATRAGTERVEGTLTEAARRHLLTEARGMLKFAHGLEPEDLAVRLLYAKVTEALGQLDEAAALYGGYLDDARPQQAGAEVHRRLGEVQARLERYDAAIVQLRLAIGSDRVGDEQLRASLLLAGVFVHLGRTAEAIDLLTSKTPPDGTYGFNDLTPVMRFALAVAYDKDEQITRAYDTLERLSTALGPALLPQLYPRFDRLPWVPAVDQHYWLALLYETTGHLPEARAEWQHYARSGDQATYRSRAEAHIANLDALLDGDAPR